MRGVWNQNLPARVAVFLVVGADEQEARHFAVRAGCRLQSDRVHARDFQKALFEKLQNFQATLRKFLRLIGMLGSDAVEAGYKFVHAPFYMELRHRSRHVSAGLLHDEIQSAREVADHFDFADFGKAFNSIAVVIRA